MSVLVPLALYHAVEAPMIALGSDPRRATAPRHRRETGSQLTMTRWSRAGRGRRAVPSRDIPDTEKRSSKLSVPSIPGSCAAVNQHGRLAVRGRFTAFVRG